MRRFLLIFIGASLIGTSATVAWLYINSGRPIVCFKLDESIRPRTRCILNPFRESDIEREPEAILNQLRNGETGVLYPLLSNRNEDSRNHIIEAEKKYQVKSWRIGDWQNDGNEASVLYWVTRDNYEWEEEVRFFLKNDTRGWKVNVYTAIY